MVPANPPEAMLVANFLPGLAPLGVANMALIASLKAKLRACVGKYLRTLAKFPETRELSFFLYYISQTSPEGVDSLSLHHSGGAVNDTLVWLVESALLDHLILVLDKELHSLNGSSDGLGDTSCYTSEHEVLSESEFLVSHYDLFILVLKL